MTDKDFCDYETSDMLRRLGYRTTSIAFYPSQNYIVDGIDDNGELYEIECEKGKLMYYSSTVNKTKIKDKIEAPLLYEAQKWLREVQNIIVLVQYLMAENGDWQYIVNSKRSRVLYHSYEEALANGVKDAVSRLKTINP